MYSSMHDGSAAREHAVMGMQGYIGPDRLGLAHYNDDVEVTNPIGAARVKHKLSLHYVRVLPPPGITDNLDLIFLVSVCLVSSQKEASMSTVMQGAPDEGMDGTSLGASLRRFNEPDGIPFKRRDGTVMRKGAWLMVSAADTLAAADLLGFKQSFSPAVQGFCWQCYATRSRDHVSAASFLIDSGLPASAYSSAPSVRTKASYRDDRVKCKSLPTVRKRGTTQQTAKGLMQQLGYKTFRHAYKRIPFAHPMTICPRDLMHIELEGNLKVHLHGFLHSCVMRYKWFSRKRLNARLKAFDFGEHYRRAGARPPQISAKNVKGVKGNKPSRKGTITMTAGHMLQFTIYSLEILRPLLPAAAFESKEYLAWAAHVLYFRVLLRRRFTEATVKKLDCMIYDAQKKFLAVPHYRPLWKPKNHFAQHIPADIRRFGPPVGYWCMRFEGRADGCIKPAAVPFLSAAHCVGSILFCSQPRTRSTSALPRWDLGMTFRRLFHSSGRLGPAYGCCGSAK